MVGPLGTLPWSAVGFADVCGLSLLAASWHRRRLAVTPPPSAPPLFALSSPSSANPMSPADARSRRTSPKSSASVSRSRRSARARRSTCPSSSSSTGTSSTTRRWTRSTTSSCPTPSSAPRGTTWATSSQTRRLRLLRRAWDGTSMRTCLRTRCRRRRRSKRTRGRGGRGRRGYRSRRTHQVINIACIITPVINVLSTATADYEPLSQETRVRFCFLLIPSYARLRLALRAGKAWSRSARGRGPWPARCGTQCRRCS